MQHVHLFDQDRESLRTAVQHWGLPAFRADQLLDWVYRKGVADPRKMTNLSAADRSVLADRLRMDSAQIVRHQIASDGTQKLLLQWPCDFGAGRSECVLIPAPGSSGRKASVVNREAPSRKSTSGGRQTACVSSQVGCPVGCRFCASGIGGVERNLTAGEIVEQVWRLQQLPGVGRISHVVFMGMGEPLANFEQVVRAVRLLMADWGLNLSGRHLTLSTVGLPAQMRRLADLELPVTLAISLHAPNDVLRRQLIPWAEYVTIQQLCDAGVYYFDRTGREITLEYLLLGGVNDRPEHARELAEVAQRLRGSINLIRYNEVAGLPYQRPATNDVLRFREILRKSRVNVHIRASRGRDIAAACGQLRHETAHSHK